MTAIVYRQPEAVNMGRRRKIVFEEAMRCGVSVQEVMGRSRLKHIAEARGRAMARMRAELGMTLHQIGRFFDRDHSTVHSACVKYLDPEPVMVETWRGWHLGLA